MSNVPSKLWARTQLLAVADKEILRAHRKKKLNNYTEELNL